MSNGPNHRREHGRIQGNGPRWENGNPEAGCNSTHVAKARKKWKQLKSRYERRTGKNVKWGGVKMRYKMTPLDDELDYE